MDSNVKLRQCVKSQTLHLYEKGNASKAGKIYWREVKSEVANGKATTSHKQSKKGAGKKKTGGGRYGDVGITASIQM